MGKLTGNSWIRGKCIGRGSFGTVNLAVDKSDGGRVFAVKSAPCDSPTQLLPLENEIRILRSLSSPHVVSFLGDDLSFEPCKTRNLHMEYLPGGTVDQLASSDVDEKSLRSYTWCVVSALRYVHGKRIVHCDVKGKNILVGAAGSSAKLADFGSAMEVDNCATSPIMPRGSPLWMAPEVIRREYQGPESDVWSLGCTVIEMVTGKPAWEDQGVDTLSRIGWSNELPEFPTQLSELGRDFVKKCLRRDWSQRWSCDQLLQHPFIATSSPNHTVDDESSPRCVLDWFGSDFEEEEEDDDVSTSSNCESYEASAKGRIGKLAADDAADWGSDDGWIAARSYGEEVGTSSGYEELGRVEGEIGGTSGGGDSGLVVEYSDSVEIRRVEWEDSKCGGRGRVGEGNEWSTWGGGGCDESCRAGCWCRHGSQKVKVAVEEAVVLVEYLLFYRFFCNLLLLIQLLLKISKCYNYILHYLLLFVLNYLFQLRSLSSMLTMPNDLA